MLMLMLVSSRIVRSAVADFVKRCGRSYLHLNTTKAKYIITDYKKMYSNEDKRRKRFSHDISREIVGMLKKLSMVYIYG